MYIEDYIGEDEIYFYKGHDFYNYSPTDEFSMFIVKDDEHKDTIKLMFYNVTNPKDYVININGNWSSFHVTNFHVLDLNIKEHEVHNIEIIDGENMKHLWLGEPSVQFVHNEIVKRVVPVKFPLPTEIP